jgi:hypothetical protein
MWHVCGEVKEKYVNDFGRKTEGKRSLERPRHRREKFKIALKKICWGVVDLVNLAHYRIKWLAVVNMVVNICFPQNAWNVFAI